MESYPCYGQYRGFYFIVTHRRKCHGYRQQNFFIFNQILIKNQLHPKYDLYYMTRVLQGFFAENTGKFIPNKIQIKISDIPWGKVFTNKSRFTLSTTIQQQQASCLHENMIETD